MLLLVVFAALFEHVVAVSGKRGLIGVNNIHSFGDQSTLMSGNATTWAYNYGTQPGNSTWFGSLEFVPQLWGGDAAASFASEVLANVPATRHILTFNEPDSSGDGQATMTPALAATIWKQYVEPLRTHNIKLGSPACTGTDTGIEWLKQFYGNCTTCHIDFIATHWYGSFQGLAAHLGNLYNVFNGTTMWVTEMAIADASVTDTDYMFNTSTSWLDGLDWVERYAWFGGFRSTDSNVGTNATFLNAVGSLTSLGKEYLFQVASNSSTASSTTTTSASRGATRATTSASPSSTTPTKSDSNKLQHTSVIAILGLFFSITLVA